MSEEPSAPEVPPPPSPAPARRSALAAALPYLATVVAAVAVSLLLQALFFPRPTSPAAVAQTAEPPTPTTTAPIATALPLSPTTASAPRPTPALSDDSVLALQILDLEEQNRQLWSAVYLLRAASQLNDTIDALQANDLDEADRTILTAYRSLDRAYDASAEQEKGPIDTFRLQLSSIRDDLRVRPEGVDRRLRQLRQLMLSLVDEGG